MEIICFPDKRLRQKCRALTEEELKGAVLPEVGKPLSELVDDIIETMAGAGGLGLAAPQVGVPVRMFVMHVGDVTVEVVNPVLSFGGWVQNFEEGCLSLPGVRVRTERFSKVKLSSPSLSKELKFSALMAACVQHECDHLDGVLITDAPRHRIL